MTKGCKVQMCILLNWPTLEYKQKPETKPPEKTFHFYLTPGSPFDCSPPCTAFSRIPSLIPSRGG